MSQRWLLVIVGFALLINAGQAAENIPAMNSADTEFFERRVRPILVERCYSCHSSSANELAGELLLDSREGWTKGGASGPAIVPGDPTNSLVVRAVRYTDSDLKMPPKNKLPSDEIELLEKWVAAGAPDPRETRAAVQPAQKSIDVNAGRSFWAFQPRARPSVPEVKDTTWARTDIDRFVLAALESAEIGPTNVADRRTLIRRASFDLTGLPPTPAQIAEFLEDPSDDAFAKIVDRLLDSPAYGERWGRHWLDVARYADSNGLDENAAFGNAWRYRDYVVDAFNRDKPFDHFLMEQIAGDLLPTDDSGLRHERLIATGFLSLGPKVLAEPDETKMEMDVIDEQIDTLGKAFMGLTLGCARCHDHKFDPIPTADYYALAGIFRSTQTMEKRGGGLKVSRWWENSLASEAEERLFAGHQAEVAAKKTLLKAAQGDEQKSLKSEIEALEKIAPILPSALGVRDAEVVNLRVHRRGSHLALGDEVPRGFLQVLTTQPAALPTKQSGRLELAEWLVRPDHPLTSRVMVNRIWRWHFGRGLVETPDNFGVMGARPTNQPLLDWLAGYFMQQGWSVKAMHRLIMNSSVYQLSSSSVGLAAQVDSDNRLNWRMNLQRLEAEQIRDAMLSVSDALDPTAGGPACQLPNRELVFNHTSKDETRYDSRRRSIYLPVIRNHVYDLFQQFDFPEPSTVNGNRPTTTVSPQALLLLNSEFVLQCSEKFADRLFADSALEDRKRVELAYRWAYGRAASDAEIERALDFVRRFAEAPAKPSAGDPVRSAWNALAQALLTSNEFVYLR